MIVNNLIYVADRYIPAALSMIFTVILSRELEVKTFGEISYFLAIAGALSVFALGGLDQLLQREIVKDKAQLELLINSYVSLKLGVALFAYTLISAITFVFLDINYIYALPLLLINVFNISESFRAEYISTKSSKDQISVTTPAAIASFLIKIAIIYGTQHTFLIYFCLLLDSLVLVIFLGYKYQTKHRFRITFDRNILSVIFRDGKYLIMSGMVLMISSYVDQLIVGATETLEVIANYALALKFVGVFVLASSAFNLGFVKMLDPAQSSFLKMCKAILIFSAAVGSILAITNAVLSPILIELIYKGKYGESRTYVIWLSITIFSYFMLSSTGRIMITIGQTKHILIRNLCAFCISLALGVTLSRQHGVLGVVVATNMGLIFSAVIYPFLTKDLRSTFLAITGFGNYSSSK